MMKKVVMIHHGRNGSTVLADMLGQHPDVHWAGEIYNQAFEKWDAKGGFCRCEHGRFKPWQLNGEPLPQPGVPFDPFHLLDQRLEQSKSPVFGFELKFWHLRLMNVGLAEMMSYLKRQNFGPWIVLRRRNTLRAIVSAIMARERGRIYQIPPGHILLPIKVKVPIHICRIDRDTRPLIDYLNTFEANFAELDSMLKGTKTLKLVYEDTIQHNPHVAYQQAIYHIGLKENEAVEVNYQKIDTEPFDEIIENYEEVKNHLDTTPYNWMI